MTNFDFEKTGNSLRNHCHLIPLGSGLYNSESGNNSSGSCFSDLEEELEVPYYLIFDLFLTNQPFITTCTLPPSSSSMFLSLDIFLTSLKMALQNSWAVCLHFLSSFSAYNVFSTFQAYIGVSAHLVVMHVSSACEGSVAYDISYYETIPVLFMHMFYSGALEEADMKKALLCERRFTAILLCFIVCTWSLKHEMANTWCQLLGIQASTLSWFLLLPGYTLIFHCSGDQFCHFIPVTLLSPWKVVSNISDYIPHHIVWDGGRVNPPSAIRSHVFSFLWSFCIF